MLLGTHGFEESDGFMSWELEPSADFELGKAEGRVSVQGRLRSHSQFWLDNLNPSSFVRDIVTQGYRIPLSVCLTRFSIRTIDLLVSMPSLWRKLLRSLSLNLVWHSVLNVLKFAVL